MTDMVAVRTLKAHANRQGGQYRKAPGFEYEAPEGMARALIAQGLVEAATPVSAGNFLDRKVDDVVGDLDALNAEQLGALKIEEEQGKARKTLLAAIDARIEALPSETAD